MDYRLVVTTCPDRKTAEHIAEHLVANRLAACVNILPGMQSVYEWKGEVCREQEFVLLIKSRQDIYPRLEKAIVDHHPYELPEVIALPVEAGLAGYLAWIDEQLDK